MTTLEDRLSGSGGIPWIPDPEKAEKFDGVSCQRNPLIGIAVDHYRRANFMGDGEYDVLVLSVDEVGDVAIHCQPTVLANEMRHARPKPGERVGVKWLGERQGTSRSYTAYKVVIERETGTDFNWGPESQAPIVAPPVQSYQTEQEPPRRQVDQDDSSIPF
jgi:hypothetical protein